MRIYRLIMTVLAVIVVACLFGVQGQFQMQNATSTVAPSGVQNPFQPTAIGVTYGMKWLATYGNKNVIPNATGLWDWGTIPLGYIILNGKMVSTGDWGDTQLIYPAFPSENPQLIIANRSLTGSPSGRLTAADLSSPYLSADPYQVAQSTGQPVLIRTPFY